MSENVTAGNEVTGLFFMDIVASEARKSHPRVIASEARQSHTKKSLQGMKCCDNLIQKCHHKE
jgi:hypothetical protein